MHIPFKTFSLLLATFLIAACAELVVKEVDYAPSRLVPESAKPSPIKFSKLRILLPPGTEIGLESGLGTGLGQLCSWTNYPVSRRVLSTRKLENRFVKETFAQALEANGYDVVDSIDIDFRPEDELQRANYFVSARVKDIDLDVCHRGPDAISAFFGIGGPRRTQGKLYAYIEWSVYDALKRTVVYKTATEGFTRRAYPNVEGMELLFYDAFEMASHNLAADEDFFNLIVHGQKPAQDWRDNTPPYGERFKDQPAQFDPREAVSIATLPLSKQPVPKHIDAVRAVNVMIQKNGHGSGFFITKDGHILTNQHVVGDAKQMRIVTKGKNHKLIAEVLRVDRVRDVALLKLLEVPENLKIEPLPIRTEKLTVSEDIYALGNPYDYGRLQDSVTKGIVSAHRLYKIEGVRLPLIQGDVDIHGGNSGGALLDEYGNIVGLSVSGYSDEQNFSTGLNFFIPITEALRALDIAVSDKLPAPYQVEQSEEEELSADEAEPLSLLPE